MELSEKEDSSVGHAASLLRHPHKPTERPPHPRATKGIIIAAIILISLLCITLIVLFVVRSRCDVTDSCRNRCLAAGRNSGAACRCDAACVENGSCCLDYEEVCVQPSQLWTCSKFRCGEERLPSSLCSCAADCEQKGDCCLNYKSTCRGEMTWLQEKCEEITKPDCPASFSKPPLILVSLDGFRSEYMRRYHDLLPNINKLRKCGTSTDYMRPSYPTKTFPNHYTVVTGLYPEAHGIVDNKMYDVTRNASFSLKSDEKFNPVWYQGEPIWITAMKNKLRTGTFFWPGSDVPIQGSYPNYYVMYNRSIPFEQRIHKIFAWLNLPQEQRPHFYTLYLEEPDHAGHYYGPMSSQVITALLQVDGIVGLMMQGLKERKLHKCVNLILLSDHGMEEASCDKAAYVSSYQSNTDDFIVIQGPAARVRPSRVPEEFFTFDYSGLVQNLSCRAAEQPMTPYLKENLPKRLHFANSIRIERVHLYMMPQWQAALKKSEVKYCSGGFHGSDNVFKNMQAVFVGYGPGLRFNSTVPPFENIEVYNVLCDLLDISPAPNNGTRGSLNHILTQPRYHPAHPAEVSSASSCSVIRPADRAADCFCSSLSTDQVKNLNQLLISTMSDPGLAELHAPYGLPVVLQEHADYCVLLHSSYISGYSKDVLMPLWVSYSLHNLNDAPRPSSSQEVCVRADVRIPANQSQSCSFYKDHHNMTYGFLHPPYQPSRGNQSESFISSNMAPMFTVFKGIWDYIHSNVLRTFVKDLQSVNIVSGPVFDQDFNGRFDHMTKSNRNEVPVPTHYFIIITRCENATLPLPDCQSQLQTLSFILPHRPDTTETCHKGSDYSWVQTWMKHHVGRVRDIELLTGLSFYNRLPVTEALQLKMFLKTF